MAATGYTLPSDELVPERIELGLRVGLLAGLYLHEFELAEVVAANAFEGWRRQWDATGNCLGLEEWWDRYMDEVESTVGGADSNRDQLETAWFAHARRLNQRDVAGHAAADRPRSESS
jgi:hypothetical protein